MRCKALALVLAVGALAFAMAQGKPDHDGHDHEEEAVEFDEMGDSATAPTLPQSRADSVVLIRHQFNHREQIIAGGVVMACIAAMMAIMNNYNPR